MLPNALNQMKEVYMHSSNTIPNGIDTVAPTIEINETAARLDRPAISPAQPKHIDRPNHFEVGHESTRVSPTNRGKRSFKRSALMAAIALAIIGASTLFY